MHNYKKDFPIFKNNPGLAFFDSAASAQKPQYVIDAVNHFVSNDYANIHRGVYELSERSDNLYHDSKHKTAEVLNCKTSEVFYTYNVTYGVNMIAQSLVKSGVIKKGETILVGIWDHHANIVPWQVIAKDYDLNVEFINVKEDWSIDRDDFDKKYTDDVKIVALGQIGSVTGQIYDIEQVKPKLRDDTFFFVDGTQAVPHIAVDVQKIGCDAYGFTGHKVFAYTGIGAIFLKKEWMRTLQPTFSGGGAIKDVTTSGCTFPNTYEKFEPGTPDIIGAVSLLKAFEYIEKIGGYDVLEKYEQEITTYTLEKFVALGDKIKLLGGTSSENRIGIFSFMIPQVKNQNLIGETFAEHNICVRCGGHCAYPLHRYFGEQGTCRMSLYIYNTKEDIDRFFEVLNTLV